MDSFWRARERKPFKELMHLLNSVKRVIYWVKDADFVLLNFPLSVLICKMKRLKQWFLQDLTYSNSDLILSAQFFTT